MSVRRVVLVGDSMVSAPYQHYSAEGVRVVGVHLALQALLGSAFEVISYGIGGSTSSTARDIARFAAAGHRPEFLIWATGTNDVTTGVDAATMELIYQFFLADMAAYGGDVEVITCTVPPTSIWNGAQDAVQDAVNTWYRANATRLVDRDLLWADPLDATQLNPDYLNGYEPADFVHVNDAGNAAWAQALYAELTA